MGTRTWACRCVAPAMLVLSVGVGATFSSRSVNAQAQGGPIFRLLTFEAGGGADILDVHNGIRWLIHSTAAEGRTLSCIPAEIKTLIQAGPRSIAAVRQVFQTLAVRKVAGTLKDNAAARVPPGDMIQTGVPAPVVKLRAGDAIEITIERPGTLRNRVVANAAGSA
jgi:hypothetical protein